MNPRDDIYIGLECRRICYFSNAFLLLFFPLPFGFSFFWIVFLVVACRDCYRLWEKKELKEEGDEERKEWINSPRTDYLYFNRDILQLPLYYYSCFKHSTDAEGKSDGYADIFDTALFSAHWRSPWQHSHPSSSSSFSSSFSTVEIEEQNFLSFFLRKIRKKSKRRRIDKFWMSDRFHSIHGSVMVITIIVPRRHDYLDDKALLFSFLFFFLRALDVSEKEKERISFSYLAVHLFICSRLSGKKK